MWALIRGRGACDAYQSFPVISAHVPCTCYIHTDLCFRDDAPRFDDGLTDDSNISLDTMFHNHNSNCIFSKQIIAGKPSIYFLIVSGML